LVGARAYGLDVIDGVYNDFKDALGFRAECEHGRTLFLPPLLPARGLRSLVRARAVLYRSPTTANNFTIFSADLENLRPHLSHLNLAHPCTRHPRRPPLPLQNRARRTRQLPPAKFRHKCAKVQDDVSRARFIGVGDNDALCSGLRNFSWFHGTLISANATAPLELLRRREAWKLGYCAPVSWLC
jgi:hypothetical protein